MVKKYIISGILAASAAAMFSACSTAGGSAVQVETQPAAGPMTLSAISDRDTETHFRAVGIGTNKDLMTAKSISLAEARTQLANKVQTRVEAVIASATKAKDVNGENVITTISRDAISKQVTNQTLSEMQQYTDTLHKQKPNGDYEVWTGLEVPRAVVANAVVSAVDGVSQSDPAVAAVKEQLKQQALADLLKSDL